MLPFEHDYRDEPLSKLLNQFESAREETFWLLRMLDEEEWRRRGDHPYRGLISVYDLVHDLHQHDLEHLYQARKLRLSLAAR